MKNCLLIVFILSAHAALAQPVKRLSVNFGSGSSYSLFYHDGGWVRNFGAANVGNITEKRTAYSFSHFLEAEYKLRNPRWSLRVGYSMHHFFPEFEKEGQTPNGTSYYISTHEGDRYTYLQPTVGYAILAGRNRLEVSSGLYIVVNRREGIEYYDLAFSGNNTPGPGFTISEYHSSEAGFPFNLDYLHTIKNGNAIGIRANFNYTQSVRTAEHIGLQIFFKAALL